MSSTKHHSPNYPTRIEAAESKAMKLWGTALLSKAKNISQSIQDRVHKVMGSAEVENSSNFKQDGNPQTESEPRPMNEKKLNP